MPRRYYRKRTVVVRPKKKWASIMKGMNSSQTLTSGQSRQIASYDLVVNSADSATPTPIIIKTGNFKITGTLTTDLTAANMISLYQVNAYVMYCPQGYTYDDYTKITNHPEYIMARKALTYVPGQQTTFTLSSRLKRNLNSGDSVMIVIVVDKNSTLTGTLGEWFTLTYYTCAN